MNPLRLGILGSGKGTNCRAILERIQSGELQAKVAVVISDVFDAPILDIAREFGIPAVVGTSVALSTLVDGEPLEVDGSAGIVRRLTA